MARDWPAESVVPLLELIEDERNVLTGTAAGIGWQQGFDGGLFALAATMCFVVLYDAAGVRRAAGITAQRVNGLPDGLWDPHPDASKDDAAPQFKPLKENLGHTRLEVLIGALLGPLVALPGLVLVGSPLVLAQHWGLLPIG